MNIPSQHEPENHEDVILSEGAMTGFLEVASKAIRREKRENINLLNELDNVLSSSLINVHINSDNTNNISYIIRNPAGFRLTHHSLKKQQERTKEKNNHILESIQKYNEKNKQYEKYIIDEDKDEFDILPSDTIEDMRSDPVYLYAK